MTAADHCEQVLAVVREQGPISTTKVRTAIRARAERTDSALRALATDRLVKRTPEGWDAAGQAGTGVRSACPRVTAAELAAMLRPERVRAIWNALSPNGRDRAWAALSDQQRVDAIAVVFDATSAENAL